MFVRSFARRRSELPRINGWFIKFMMGYLWAYLKMSLALYFRTNTHSANKQRISFINHTCALVWMCLVCCFYIQNEFYLRSSSSYSRTMTQNNFHHSHPSFRHNYILIVSEYCSQQMALNIFTSLREGSLLKISPILCTKLAVKYSSIFIKDGKRKCCCSADFVLLKCERIL